MYSPAEQEITSARSPRVKWVPNVENWVPPRDLVRAQYTSLTGAELTQILQKLGVPKRRFARHTGRNEATINRWCSGKEDGTIPLWIEWFLMMYWMHPQMRNIRQRLSLPLRRWGIDRDPDVGEEETMPETTESSELG